MPNTQTNQQGPNSASGAPGLTKEDYTGNIDWARLTTGIVSSGILPPQVTPSNVAPTKGASSSSAPVTPSQGVGTTGGGAGSGGSGLLPYSPGGQVGNQTTMPPGSLDTYPIAAIQNPNESSPVFRTKTGAPTSAPKIDKGAAPGSTIGLGQIAFTQQGQPVIGMPIAFPHGNERPATYNSGGNLMQGDSLLGRLPGDNSRGGNYTGE